MTRGSTLATPEETIRATGVSAWAVSASSEASSSAQAPSLRPEEFPAVTLPLPSCRKAGFNFASFSSVVSGRMNSSSDTTTGACPFFP